MCKYLVNSETLGNRLTGYMFYESKTKEFIGMTEKAILTALKNGEVLNGFKLNDEELELDTEGFHQTNLLARSGINTYTAVVESDCPVNNFYTVVKVMKENNKTVYEVISSRHGRTDITEEKLKIYLEMGIIQGGAWLDSKGKINIAKGVEVEADSYNNEKGLPA